MSGVASPPLSVVRETTFDVDSLTAAPLVFSFAPQRQKAGIVQGVIGVSLALLGAFLISQISTTPALVAQLAILGAVGVIGGLALMTRAVSDLAGRLVIDDTGISIRPAMTGYAISWNELSRWDVKLETEKYPEANGVLFWTGDEPCAMFI
jgi:hypothetical protein